MSQDPAPSPADTKPLPEVTLEAVARSFVKHAKGYGFALGDFVRFVNILLSVAMKQGAAEKTSQRVEAPRPPRVKHHHLPIAGERVTIRKFEPSDRAVLDRWVDDADGRFFLLSMASGQSHDVDHLIASPSNLLGVIEHEGEPAGCVAYLDYDARQKRAELRKMIGDPKKRGRGLAREATELWLGYGAGALGLKKVYLNTLSTHIGNIKINEELGFRVEGILRSEVLVDGEHRDVLRMGLWNEG